MALPSHRPLTGWVISHPVDPSKGAQGWSDSVSMDLIMEELEARATVRELGRNVFSGTISQKNKLWGEYRNFLIQGMSNFRASRTVPNRSAGLLQYYGLLNLAKAELMLTNPGAIVGKRLGHGLSFNPLAARSVAGDQLSVQNGGVFGLLYESRTGRTLPTGTLSVKALLRQIPEVSTQLTTAGIGKTRTEGLFMILAVDATHTWPLMGITAHNTLNRPTLSALTSTFKQVAKPPDYKQWFGLSPRWGMGLRFYEGKVKTPLKATGDPDWPATVATVWAARDVFGSTTHELYDGWLVQSLSSSVLHVMPPSLARYAIAFYTSSLVRYRPSMFDSQHSAHQAVLFDAITRELSLPMLQDSFSGLLGQEQFFTAPGAMRT
jgi:hypothetical protein